MAAASLVRQAEGKLKGGFLSFLTGGPNYDEAAELYQQAANQYKLAKDWQEAATCFIQCAFCANKSGSQTDESNYYVEAGNVLKKLSSLQAVEQFEKAIAIYNAGGRFSSSGKLLLNIAEMYEAENRASEVKNFYKRASEMFELEEHGKSSFTKCQLKVAQYGAEEEGGMPEAIRIFEAEGEKALQNTLLQYGAKDHFFRAGILTLAMGDSVTANLALDKYRSLDPRFASSREGELLGAICEAFEASDVDMFTDRLAEFDTITPLDPWKTRMLVKVKQHMGGGATLDAAAVDLS